VSKGVAGIVLCVAALLAGCAEAPTSQRPSPPQSQSPSASRSPDKGAASPVDELFADPRLDPIRNKVPLVLHPGTVTRALLANEDRPTPPEKQAIKVWMSIREQAQQYQLEHQGPPSARLVRTRQLVTRAMLQLYNGELTYGQFARRIQELDSEYQAAARQAYR
jgi:hypothetical protein